MQFPVTVILINLIAGCLLGLYLGYIWNNNTVKYKGPDSSKIRKEIYKMDGTCFSMIPYAVVGPLCERTIHDEL